MSKASATLRKAAVCAAPEHVPTAIDVFCGCGGGSIGFAARGFRIAAAVEVDARAAAAFAANVGVAPIVDDVRKVTPERLLSAAGLARGECTLLFGCPPCQSFTVLRRGDAETLADRDRNSLPQAWLKVVERVLPRHLAFENVPGLVEGRWRPQFDELCKGLEELRYRFIWDVMDAVDFGVPQFRRRLLLIGSRVATPRLPVASHGAPDSPEVADGRHKRWRTVRDAIGRLRKLEPGESHPRDRYHVARRHSTLNLRRLRALKEGQARADLPAQLQLSCHDGHTGHYDVYGRMWWSRPAPTLTSGCTNITRGRFAHPTQDRAITLREALRLQTFPDATTLIGTLDDMALQIGNAIPPLIAERIADVVLEMEREAQASSAQLTLASVAVELAAAAG